MSRAAFEMVINDFKTWEWEDAFNDKVCLHVVSKNLRGEFRIQQADNQDCETTDCTTLKHYSQIRMQIDSADCDSDVSREILNGMAEGEGVAAFRDSNPDDRGGHTGRLKWAGDGADLYARFRGVLNAGTHRDPLQECERCKTENHAEGWIRAAVVGGSHEGCRVAAMYAMTIDRGGDGGTFLGTLEGLLICQCSEEGG